MITTDLMSKENRPQSPESILESAIASYMRVHVGQSMTETTLLNLAHSLSDFVVDTIFKFEKGHIEHGQKFPGDCDLYKEARQEIMDLVVYLSAMKWPKE